MVHVREIGDMNPNLLNEIEHFLDLEGNEVGVEGFGDRDEALEVIAAAPAAAAAV